MCMRYQDCPDETSHTTISESAITMLMSSGRSNCGATYYVSIYINIYICIYFPHNQLLKLHNAVTFQMLMYMYVYM